MSRVNDFLGDMPILAVNGISRDRLRDVINLASHDSAWGYRVDTARDAKPHRLIFYYRPCEGATPFFPGPYDSEMMADIAMAWLETLSIAALPELMDLDGDEERGWLAYSEDWGYVDNDEEAFLAIEPHWLYYGK